MSALYIFCNRRHIVGIGDFRRYLMSDEIPNILPDGSFNFDAALEYRDDSPKLIFVHNKLMAGSIGYCLPVIDQLIAEFVKNASTFEEAVELTKSLINSDAYLKNFKSAIILGGIQHDGTAAIFSARTDTREFDLQLGFEKFSYTGTAASYDPVPWLEEQFKDHDYSLGKLIYVAQKLGELLAANDRLVSPKISLFAIGG